MTGAALHTHLHSSNLIRYLADLAVVDDAGSKQDFAGRLGHWVGVAEAIALSTALADHAADAEAEEPAGSFAAMEKQFAQVRSALMKSIVDSGSSQVLGARITAPETLPATPADIAAAYAPYRRHYLARQRDMELSAGPLRASVRQALANASPALQKLAALDAVFDEALAAHERKALSTVPLLLEKKFAQTLADYGQRLADSGQEDDPGKWLQPGGWQFEFCRELQGVLLAELDVRLQPVAGLIDAFSNKGNQADE